MRCEYFREITDSFLSGELLVETNHEVVRHLEICGVCRQELEIQKVFREKLRSAVINAPDTQLNPAFAARLHAGLSKHVEKENTRTNFWQSLFSLKSLTAAAALLFLTLSVSIFFLAGNKKDAPIAQTENAQTESSPNENLNAIWQKIADQAVGDHQHCGLEKMDYWLKNSNQETPKKINFRQNILQKAAFNPTEPMKLLHFHDCIFDGRIFTHAVIQIGNRTVSVLMTDTEIVSDMNAKSDSTITCQKQVGFQIASFVGLSKAVFVISDLPESENLNLARSLSNVMQS